MKRILCLILALIMALSLCACEMPTEDFLKEQAGQIMDNAKDHLAEEADKIIQGVADDLKEQVGGLISGEQSTNTNKTESISNSKIAITMLDVGQGLSILIESNGQYLLYDGGDRNASSYVVSYLNKQNITKLDYVVVSHYDDDHVNGIVGVLKNFNVSTVLNPDYTTTTKIYQSYLEARDANGADVIIPEVGDSFKLGHAIITVLAPSEKYDDYNEMSIAIKVQCDNFVTIITGDAEKESEANMLRSSINLNADLYVVGHHGSSSSSTDDFVEAMSPAYAFISCGKDNSYGHPHDETLTTLAKYGVNIYRSDIDGVVTCYSDGNGYSFSKDTAFTVDNYVEEWEENSDGEYVLNISSMKFHKASCSAVANMSEKNKQVSNEDRDTLINNGYAPCGYCNP